MRRPRFVSSLVPLVVLTLLGSALPAAADPTAEWDTGPVRAAIDRLLSDEQSRGLELQALPRTGTGTEQFTVSRDQGKVLVAATTPSAMLAGFNAYLGRVAKVNVSWDGDSLGKLPQRLPLPSAPIRQTATVANRFALNDTDDGYTGAYRTWEDWEREIDVLALHGINQVFVPVGAEAVYLETFRQFGYTTEELLAWIPQPSHQPWWLLQNMSGFPSPLTADQVDKRAALGRKIADRLRELGMTPVLPGYFGTVPAGFAAKVPGARTVPQGSWVGFDRPDWLDPTSTAFPAVAQAFYASSAKLFGTTTHYKMDLLHEGGLPGPVPVGPASKAVQDALEAARPDSTWVFLGWQNNPRPDTLAAIDRSKVLVVDGLSDRYPDTNRNQTWPDTEYAFGAIWNFGGHTTMGANTGVWEDRFWSWRAEPGSRLNGIAVMPEASDNNPAAFDYLTGLAWRDATVGRDDWFTDWATRRYGASDASAAKAWRALGATAYNLPADGDSEAQDGLYAAEPSLDAASAATWSPAKMQYEATAFAAALPALVNVRPALRDSTAYRYDLMDVARQVLSNRSRTLLPRLKAAYDGKRQAEFDRLAAEWMRQLDLLDEVTATNEQTMLGPWLADARASGAEQSARTLLTVWGRRAGYDAGLADYANREWSGLISGYYAPRWKSYLTELSNALKENRTPKKFDWFQYGADWAASTASLPTTPQGDIHRAASKVLDYLRANPEPLTTTVTVAPPNVADGGTTHVTAKVHNDDPFLTAKRVSVSLTAPPTAGLTIPQPTADLPALAPGQEATTTFTVKATGTATEFHANLTATIKASTGTAIATARVFRSGQIQPPNLIRTTNAAVFGQLGDKYLIEGAGADLWGGTNHFGAIYRENVLAPGTSVTTRIVAQDRTGPWARAGLITSTDLAVGASGRGFANIALTPDNGCVFSYDSTNDGNLDSFRQLPGVIAPAWVRLSRTGDTVTGWCSTDGTTWQPAGSVAVPAGASLDGGLFMSAANGGSGTRGAAQFEGLAVNGG